MEKKTIGVVEKINAKKAKVCIAEGRGIRSQPGQIWCVPYSLMEPSNQSAPPVQNQKSDQHQTLLKVLIRNISQSQGTNYQGALRDLLTDLRHVAVSMELDFSQALEGSEEVFEEAIQEVA